MLKLEVDKKYKVRSGATACILYIYKDLPEGMYPIQGTVEGEDGKAERASWTYEGFYYSDGFKNRYDIIEEVTNSPSLYEVNVDPPFISQVYHGIGKYLDSLLENWPDEPVFRIDTQDQFRKCDCGGEFFGTHSHWCTSTSNNKEGT